MDQNKPVGVKNDRKDDKPMWELLPLLTIEEVVKVYTAGAKKYGPDNWMNLEDGYRRYKAALFRHICEFERGNWIDPDTGCIHLAQVAWNAIAMLHIEMGKRNKPIPATSDNRVKDENDGYEQDGYFWKDSDRFGG